MVGGFEVVVCVVHGLLSYWIGVGWMPLHPWLSIIQKFFRFSVCLNGAQIFYTKCVKNWDLQRNAVKITLYTIFLGFLCLLFTPFLH